MMKQLFNITLVVLVFVLTSITAGAQSLSPLEQLKANPRKAYGTDYPYHAEQTTLTPAPAGYQPFYISHYARHGSRYYWNDELYLRLDTLLSTAHERQLFTAEGEAFYNRFMAAKDELMTGVSELTQLGWEQHQDIARTMYNRFPEVFEHGGNVLAISSISGRCMLSMSAFCQELVQCNPMIEIREQASRFTLDGVVPTDHRNPVKHNYPNVTPRYEDNRDRFQEDNSVFEKVLTRAFTSTDGLPYDSDKAARTLVEFYMTLPSIYYEGMMGNIVNDEEVATHWETENLGTYSWVFSGQYELIPVLEDILHKAENVMNGTSDHVADLRFGHDSCIGPLTVLMGINGADRDPEDPYEVKNCYQNWQTCKACNIQLVFYRNQNSTDPYDVLVKCLLNGTEASLPVPVYSYPYYKWTDFRDFYISRITAVQEH